LTHSHHFIIKEEESSLIKQTRRRQTHNSTHGARQLRACRLVLDPFLPAKDPSKDEHIISRAQLSTETVRAFLFVSHSFITVLQLLPSAFRRS
jgi:hypothetical protein